LAGAVLILGTTFFEKKFINNSKNCSRIERGSDLLICTKLSKKNLLKNSLLNLLVLLERMALSYWLVLSEVGEAYQALN
jgi:hypothetical protein